MQGIIVMDKPSGFTSFDVIAKLRGILKTKKIGHSGTLDPMATGVLPVFVGGATKAVDMQLLHDKAYTATILFGTKTNTADITGEVILKEPCNITQLAFTQAIKQFIGVQSQLPPMYSAVKINGMPLYKAARKGVEVARTPRCVEIYSIAFEEQTGNNEFRFNVLCSKGTYVRTLCEDIGAALGTVAVLTALSRTKAGAYGLDAAHTFEEVQRCKDEGCLEKLFTQVETVFMHLDKLQLDDQKMKSLLNGAFLTENCKDNDYRLIYNGSFVGVAVVQDNILRAKKLFCEREVI